MSEQTRAMTIRLEPQMAENLALVARVDGMPAAEVVRTAVGAYIAGRTRDPGFRERLREHLASEARMLDGA